MLGGSNVRMSIAQYDESDTLIQIYTGTFLDFIEAIDDPCKYYYRVVAFKNRPRIRVQDIHFNVQTSCVGGLKFDVGETLNRYLNFMIKEHVKGRLVGDFTYVLAHFHWYVWKLAKMKKYASKELLEFQLSYLQKEYPKLIEIDDLDAFRHKSGIYVMVLDEYHVCYVGQATDLRARIMFHWSRADYHTGTGIDLFKAYDTTRLFVLECDEKVINRLEHGMVDKVDKRVSLNIMAGGDMGFHLETGLSPFRDGYLDLETDVPATRIETDSSMIIEGVFGDYTTPYDYESFFIEER